MKDRKTQLAARKNPGSSRVHALRLSQNPVSPAVEEINLTIDRTETPALLTRRMRTFELPLTEVVEAKRDQPNARPIRSSLNRADEAEPNSSLMTRVLSRGVDLHAQEGTANEEATTERHHKRGKWSVSPLWEAKILLGVLRQQGLAGKGLVEAFEKWAPRIAGSSRANMSRLYREQTGRELSDYILVQQADKVVRYNQFPPDAEVVRRALLNSRRSPTPEATSPVSTRFKACPNVGAATMGQLSAQRREVQSRAKKREVLTASAQRLLDNHDPNVLLSTNELATLIGFRPKTIRRWVSRRLLNYIRVGNRFRFRLAAVELFLAQREVRK
ncbi:MAG: helix-turn-helix domain-containing protein [Acidobacteriota bacterium]|nr:helix-turn-helix domain-containing protein [Acidobacteriota bacterium]